MDEQKDLNYVFNETPLYSKEVFNILNQNESTGVYELNRKELFRFNKYIETHSDKIVTNCIWCDKEFSFDYIKLLNAIIGEEIRYEQTSIQIAFPQSEGLNISLFDYHNTWGLTTRHIQETDLIERNYYLDYYISCNNNATHIYYLCLLIRVQKDKIIVTKVGQYPTMLSVKGFDFDKYKKQLNNYNAYEDYKNADLSMNQTFYAGAYTYLRRVYEKQLNYYIDKDKPTLADDRIETKIKAVKGNFDSRIHGHLKNLYS